MNTSVPARSKITTYKLVSFEADAIAWTRLTHHYPRRASEVLRRLIRAHINMLEHNGKLEPVPTIEIGETPNVES